MITNIKGDVTYPVGDGIKIIAHVCNNKRAWGAGVVLSISDRWPQPEASYRSLLEYVLGKVYLVKVEYDIYVANMIAQNGFYKSGYIPLQYDALETCLKKLNAYASKVDAKIHMPKIGSGLGGGDWNRILKIIEDTALVDVTIYELDK